ncbi:DUF7547 family protein [Natronobacterium gregoryi]|uniref:Uncharacterized protein n=2 Tax=Natronobacterium gregoryi TaxID=44930 RepID=L0AL61_NATGS|nr:hypothetical protein [Natronobacterium gregoryi]AFZ74613.1 hypothetical protein Natgr_3494 [Natronobacterium gregoryi SP2]ELY72565.1 hypothetical protein C490_03213 [Natronobacterium gregoryi SP2]PLK19799.1 hypothetical protein CYV19_12890 [Natronobacterium gregoryi SP2]SFJ30497.1 hypothetical protein SAMN05443661_12131 [Natronobacterium gregoryi]
MADTDEELAEAVRELRQTIDELRQELEPERSRRRPRLRPPTPREVLAFTDEIALPAALSVLEASVRALETFQRGLRLVRTEREASDRTTEATTAASDRAEQFRETTLSRLDTVLEDLQRAASEGALPADEEARDLLTEARRLRDEVDDRLQGDRAGSGDEASNWQGTGPVSIDVEEGAPPEPDSSEDEDEPDPSIDVEAELETLKDQYGPEEKRADDSLADRADDDSEANDSSEADSNGEGGESDDEN